MSDFDKFLDIFLEFHLYYNCQCFYVWILQLSSPNIQLICLHYLCYLSLSTKFYITQLNTSLLVAAVYFVGCFQDLILKSSLLSEGHRSILKFVLSPIFFFYIPPIFETLIHLYFIYVKMNFGVFFSIKKNKTKQFDSSNLLRLCCQVLIIFLLLLLCIFL